MIHETTAAAVASLGTPHRSIHCPYLSLRSLGRSWHWHGGVADLHAVRERVIRGVGVSPRVDIDRIVVYFQVHMTSSSRGPIVVTVGPVGVVKRLCGLFDRREEKRLGRPVTSAAGYCGAEEGHEGVGRAGKASVAPEFVTNSNIETPSCETKRCVLRCGGPGLTRCRKDRLRKRQAAPSEC